MTMTRVPLPALGRPLPATYSAWPGTPLKRKQSLDNLSPCSRPTIPTTDSQQNPPSDAGAQPYAWLTAPGRRSGQPRTVELWFALRGMTLYFLAGGGASADWVRNSLAAKRVSVRLASTSYQGTARAVEAGTAEEDEARRLLAAKYQGWQHGRPLSRWARESFPVAVELEGTFS